MTPRALAPLIFLLSAVLLAQEVALVRILAWWQWQHLAYLAISLALLGFGAAGSLYHRFRGLWDASLRDTVVGALVFTALAILIGRWALSLIPADAFLVLWRWRELGWLLLLCGLLFLPFLGGGLLLVVLLASTPGRVGLYYGANLIGSGVGAFGVLLLLDRLHPVDIPPLLALLLVIPVLFHGGRRWSLGGWLVGFGAAVTLIGLPPPQLSQYKELAQVLAMPGTELLAERPSSRGVLDLVASPYLRSAAGLGLTYRGEIPVRPALFLDGSMVGLLPPAPGEGGYLSHTLAAGAFAVRPAGRVLDLGGGTGAGAALALDQGADGVTLVEPNGSLVALLEGHYPASPYWTEGVRAVVEEPRALLEVDESEYGLILLPPPRGVAEAGMHAIYEDYLFTLEGLQAAAERLGPGGMLLAVTPLDTPPRRPLRVAALLTALHGQLLPEARITDHLLIWRSWNGLALLWSPDRFTVAERERLDRFVAGEGFERFPADARETPPPLPPGGGEAAGWGLDAPLAEILHGGQPASPFRLQPPTDDRPYFLQFLTWAALPPLLEAYGPRGVLLAEWGYLMVWLTLGGLLVLGALLIFYPLRRLQGGPAPRGAIPYFAGLGLGFMLVEIYLIQRLVRILGDPVHAVALVIAGLLIFSGIGSLASGRLRMAPARLARLALLTLVILFGGFLILFPPIAKLAAGLPAAARFPLCLVTIAPLALVMGLFFPTGIRHLALQGRADWIPWAWGVNGLCSVLAAPLGVLIAVNGGLMLAGGVGMVCYGGAVVAWGGTRR